MSTVLSFARVYIHILSMCLFIYIKCVLLLLSDIEGKSCKRLKDASHTNEQVS